MYCKICGKTIKNNKTFCDKHEEEISTYGFAVTDSPRTKDDPNEIIEKENYIEMFLYDDLQEEVDETAILDLSDKELIKDIRWDIKNKNIISRINNKVILLQNYLLNSNGIIEFINGNNLDFRRENLRIIEKDFKIKKIDKRKKGKIDIVGLGTSINQVTGSCWGVFYDNIKEAKRGLILLECGSAQGDNMQVDYSKNKDMVNKIPFEMCDLMIFTHPHMDHIGNSVAAISRGFNGRILMTKQQRLIAEKLLLDGCFIHERNVKELQSKGKAAELLYTESDVYLFLSKVEEVKINTIIKINDNVSVRFRKNSHTVGATQIELWIRKESNQVKHIVYTGDLGSKYNLSFQPFLTENEIIPKADMYIFESTYASSARSFSKQQCIDERRDLKEVLLNTIKTKTRCVLPSFSYSRSQSIMCMIYDWFKDSTENFMVIVDSKLTNDINNIYREVLEGEEREYWNEVLSWSKFKFITSYKDSLALASRNDDIPKIIISSSGFGDAGHIRIWLSKMLNHKEDTVCFIGYSSTQSLSGRIREQASNEFMIDGIRCKRKCNIKTYKTFSSHIQQDELINYFKQISTDKVILHHGNTEDKQTLKELAKNELRKIGKTTKIVLSEECCEFKL